MAQATGRAALTRAAILLNTGAVMTAPRGPRPVTPQAADYLDKVRGDLDDARKVAGIGVE